MNPPRHMTPDEFRARGRDVIDWIAAYMERIESLPVSAAVSPGAVAAEMPRSAPERPEPWTDILSDLDRVVMPGITHWQSPSFFGFFPANASGPAMLADLISAGLGVQGMLWSTSPACTEVEIRVLDWLGELVGLPETFLSRSGAGGGVIQGTASESSLVAMVAALHRARRRGAGPLRVYTSSQAHSSIAKAAQVLGLGADGLRLIDVDEGLAMRPEALRAAIEGDLRSGGNPAFVCATVGTTSSTAMDPVRPIAEVCRDHGLWLHVDAAYAGAMCVCPEHRGIIDGVEGADSFNFNAHKWLLTNFDCSALWVRDRRALTDALSITPEYLRNAASDSGAVIDYRDWQIPLGRRFRALKLWFVIRHYGAEGLRAHIREHLRLAALFESLVREDDRFEIAAPRTAGLVCFRLRASDDVNRALLAALNATRRLFLTHTALPDPPPDGAPRITLRMAIGGAQTQERHVRRAWDTIRSEADRLARQAESISDAGE